MPSVKNPSVRPSSVVQWLGIPGVVLLAAVVCDLLIVLTTGSSVGRGVLLLPGSLALAACALWSRSAPLAAAVTAVVLLGASTVLLNDAEVRAFPTLLRNITFGETVAGFILVTQCARLVRPLFAVGAIGGLVSVALFATEYRPPNLNWQGFDHIISLAAGSVLLLAAVITGIRLRAPDAPRPAQGFGAELLRDQWPLIGIFSVLLFVELTSVFDGSLLGLVVVLTSVVSATAAVLASRYAERGAMGVGVAMFGAVVITVVTDDSAYSAAAGIPPTQVLAGMAVVVALVRKVSAYRALAYIAALSALVAYCAAATTPRSLEPLAVSASLLLGISVAFGLFLRSRDSERRKTVESAVTDAQTAERMALARELHDVVAHHVTGIVVQAQAAQMVSGTDPSAAVDALGRIETAGTEALGAMRRLVGSMRGEPPAGTTTISEQATTDLTADLRRLVETASLGVPTEVTVDLPDAIPQEVARSTLRIVQESLTNVGKHAPGATVARVAVSPIGDELHVRIHNDDPAPGPGGRAAPGGSGGYGLVGMRERVELLDGRLSAGPHADGGWLVEAWLPCETVKPEGEQ
ncbi:two-component sensor histidine kinase [Amycolatopsis antarctica]|uniref:histidine kinase n=1 Tax=Amycolatopsis antarctica TaxID=1854586 RepID=A0A263D2P3_9PSEU|nr:histidine kinase [Amycolatopsis antarctica]OZM72744.1 two-component sensor histidine kinase [Amycolatopsis antarctica]